MAYRLGGALDELYNPDDLEPLTTPHQRLRLGLEPPRSSPFYELERELAAAAAPVLYRNLSQDSDQGTRAVTPELVDQLLRARSARSINDPRGTDTLRDPAQVAEATRGPSFTEKVAADYLPRAALYAADLMKPQIFHEYMTDAENRWKEGDYGSSAAYLGLAPLGALADVAGTVILPAALEKNLGAAAARTLSRAGRAADDVLGGSRAATVGGLTAGGAAMMPGEAEAGPPKWYSPLRKVIEEAPQEKATMGQWLGYLRNRPGVKAEELEYTLGRRGADVLDLTNKPTTKRELLRHLEENDVPVEENFYGLPLSRAERELVEGPPATTIADIDRNIELMREAGERKAGNPKYPSQNGGYRLLGPADYYREIMVSSPRAEPDWATSSGHFGSEGIGLEQKDIKASQQSGWIRGDVRKLEDGSRAFHVDEFQSDPAQRALKRGWKGGDSRSLKEDWLKVVSELRGHGIESQDYAFILSSPDHPQKELVGRALDLHSQMTKADGKVPDRPWKKDWPKLLFRRALWEAVQEDADQLTWTTAETQARRWDGPRVGRDRLYEEVIPKIAREEAKRLGLPEGSVGTARGDVEELIPSEVLESDLADIADTYSGEARRESIVSYAKDKKLPPEVIKKLESLDPTSDDWEDSAFDAIPNLNDSATLYSLKLTPEVRRKILKEGLPKFVGAGVSPALLDRFFAEEPGDL